MSRIVLSFASQMKEVTITFTLQYYYTLYG